MPDRPRSNPCTLEPSPLSRRRSSPEAKRTEGGRHGRESAPKEAITEGKAHERRSPRVGAALVVQQPRRLGGARTTFEKPWWSSRRCRLGGAHVGAARSCAAYALVLPLLRCEHRHLLHQSIGVAPSPPMYKARLWLFLSCVVMCVMERGGSSLWNI
jgi:hypothetical protein